MTRNREIRQLQRKLEERCRFIADTLRFRRLASEKELADYFPGGEENKDKSIEGWIFAYANYVRFCDRIPDENTPSQNLDTDDDVIRALADTPEAVTLSSGASLTVHPKSFVALQLIERADARVEWLTRKRAQLIERDQRMDLETLDRISEEVAYQYGVMAWIATTQGPGIPFDEIAKANIELPESIMALSTTDLLQVRHAFIRVNAVRLHALMQMMKGDTDSNGRPSWKTFFAMREDDRKVSAAVLMRDRSLASQVASSLLVADAQRSAMETAQRRENVV